MRYPFRKTSLFLVWLVLSVCLATPGCQVQPQKPSPPPEVSVHADDLGKFVDEYSDTSQELAEQHGCVLERFRIEKLLLTKHYGVELEFRTFSSKMGLQEKLVPLAYQVTKEAYQNSHIPVGYVHVTVWVIGTANELETWQGSYVHFSRNVPADLWFEALCEVPDVIDPSQKNPEAIAFARWSASSAE